MDSNTVQGECVRVTPGAIEEHLTHLERLFQATSGVLDHEELFIAASEARKSISGIVKVLKTPTASFVLVFDDDVTRHEVGQLTASFTRHLTKLVDEYTSRHVQPHQTHPHVTDAERRAAMAVYARVRF